MTDSSFDSLQENVQGSFIASNAAEGTKPCCEILLSCYEPLRTTPIELDKYDAAVTHFLAGRETTWRARCHSLTF